MSAAPERRPRYSAAMHKVMTDIQAAYLAASYPVPHPVWWKRLLGREHRVVDWTRYMDELRRIRKP